MRVTVTVDIDGRAASVTMDIAPRDAGLDDGEPGAMLALVLQDAQERASADARKGKRTSPRHAWAGFLRDLARRVPWPAVAAVPPVPRVERRPAPPPPVVVRPPPLVEFAQLELAAMASDILAVLPEVAAELVPSGAGGALLPRGRFGEHKVFIAAAHRALKLAGSRYGILPPDTFKRLLLIANRDGLLALSRADLVAAMDPAEVAASTIEDGGAVFHFVQAPPVRRK